MHGDLSSLNKVWEIQVLTKRPRANEARSLLERAVAMVDPILQRRGWKINLLREFFPRSSNLLGLNENAGQRVSVRCRPANAPNSFFPFEHILGTLLNEITHITVGPHNKNFYKLLDELTEECERDAVASLFSTSSSSSSSSSGLVFTGEGQRVQPGRGGKRKLPLNARRKAAAEAALRRQRLARLGLANGSGRGRKLGGESKGLSAHDAATGHTIDLTESSGHASFSPIKLAERVRRAALKRAEDDRWCGCGGGREISEVEGGNGSLSTAAAAATAAAASVAAANITKEITGRGSDGDDRISTTSVSLWKKKKRIKMRNSRQTRMGKTTSQQVVEGANRRVSFGKGKRGQYIDLCDSDEEEREEGGGEDEEEEEEEEQKNLVGDGWKTGGTTKEKGRRGGGGEEEEWNSDILLARKLQREEEEKIKLRRDEELRDLAVARTVMETEISSASSSSSSNFDPTKPVFHFTR